MVCGVSVRINGLYKFSFFYLVSFRKFILEFVVPPRGMIVEVILCEYVDTYIYLVLHLDR